MRFFPFLMLFFSCVSFAIAGEHSPCARALTSLMRYSDMESWIREKPSHRHLRATHVAYKNNNAKRMGRRFIAQELFSWGPAPVETENPVCITCEGSTASLQQKIETIRSLRRGDQLELEDGSIVTLAEYLGDGNGAQVFGMEEDRYWTIRLPVASQEKTFSQRWTRAFGLNRRYLTSYPLAVEAGLPVLPAKIIGSIVFVKKIPAYRFLTLKNFLRALTKNQDKWDSEATFKWKKLKAFLQSLRGKPGLGDITCSQIVWDSGDVNTEPSWKIFDYTDFLPVENLKPSEYHAAYSTDFFSELSWLQPVRWRFLF